jgi:hypothetical protein
VLRRRRVARWALLGPAVAILARSSVAGAVDPFEIQVYDATVLAPRTAGVELHSNVVVSGRRASVPPELPAHHQSHFTLEAAMGLPPWWEIGAYLQTALLPDGSFEYAGNKLRTKFVVPARPDSAFRWGVNLELSRLPEHYDRDGWGAEIRPIATWSSAGGAVYVSINPIVDFGLAGMGRGQPPSFEPAATVCYVIDGLMSFGLEYYADVGPVGRWAPAGEQEHYLFQVINVLRWKRIEINAGVGEGLTEGSNDFVAKTILGFR